MLTCKNLTCTRNGKTVFSGVGFSLLPGSLLGISGRNGSGKTSLLRIIAGLLRPASGNILWEGEDVTGAPELMNSIVYAGHENAIKPELSVEDNIAHWARLRGEEILVPAAMHYWGLGNIADMPCSQLSAGWRRRVALARLMVIPAPIWLLDEPATHLDQEGKKMLYTLVSSRCNQNGIVLISHHEELEMQRVSCLNIDEFIGMESS